MRSAPTLQCNTHQLPTGATRRPSSLGEDQDTPLPSAPQGGVGKGGALDNNKKNKYTFNTQKGGINAPLQPPQDTTPMTSNSPPKIYADVAHATGVAVTIATYNKAIHALEAKLARQIGSVDDTSAQIEGLRALVAQLELKK